MQKKSNQLAVIFDMDGVVADTQKLHAQAESQVLAAYKIKISPQEISKEYAGVSDWDFFTQIITEHALDKVNAQQLIDKKWKIMNSLLAGNLFPIVGARSLIKKLAAQDIPMSIASASSLDFIAFVLKTLKLDQYFSVISSIQEVKKGKPAPDIFILSAKRLKVKPGNCIVIEDGESGIQGAKSAGMKTIGLDSESHGHLTADVLVTSLADIKLELITKLKERKKCNCQR